MNSWLIKYRESKINLVGRAIGPSLAVLIVDCINQSDGNWLVIARNLSQAEKLKKEIEFFCGNKYPVDLFPEWETLPYDNFSPHKSIISQRLKVLALTQELSKRVIIVTPPALLNRLPPIEYITTQTLILKKNQYLDHEKFINRLIESGYTSVTQVEDYAEFTKRGSLVDLFPTGSEFPIRIEIYDEKIETIKLFDPKTQISHKEINQIELLPGREFPVDKTSIERFRSKFRDFFEGQPSKSKIYRDVSAGITPGGIEYFLPLSFKRTTNLLSHLNSKHNIFIPNDINLLLSEYFEEITNRYTLLTKSKEHYLLPPEKVFFNNKEINIALESFNKITYAQNSVHDQNQSINLNTQLNPSLKIQTTHKHPSKGLLNFIKKYDGRILFTANSRGRVENLIDFLKNLQLNVRLTKSWSAFLESDDKISAIIAPFEEGVVLSDLELTIITEEQLFPKKPRQRKPANKKLDPELIIKQLSDLSIGAPVVHIEYGVGRFLGLKKLDYGSENQEFLHLEYADGDKLYVPVHSLELISRYTGTSPENAPLHKLGSEQWNKAKHNAIKKIRDVAAELLDIYAKRSTRKGFKYQWEKGDYEKFENEFPYQVTEDQENAISSVLDDLASEEPMDRVICGDVGFGKTEVAMRATLIATLNHKQVVVLAPTTLLANQHENSFKNRFKNWPIKVDLISRFQNQKIIEEVNDNIKSGITDVVIGTHKVFSHINNFKNLGLVIIDEEHRFGVRQKEVIKNLKNNVDILTLTATPIPRTLNMALGGIRELSLITTPPLNRLAIKTFIEPWQDNLIHDACQREINRGGQVYFVHNKVEDIELVKMRLSKIIPEIEIKIAHGKMKKKDLEKVMLQFYENKFSVLLCTTIIESGLDIPNANTIIINRADRFGLAQLHQLRGRVGRSHHRAYAYLISSSEKSITPDAHKRLEAISSLEDLGSGFVLASHDLEIRGAGELLGDEQSGQIQQIGFSLYTDLLSKTVDSMKKGEKIKFDEPFDIGTEVDLRLPCLLPNEYVPDVHMRLILYKRISSADINELSELKIELIDRFGLLPIEAEYLFKITALKHISKLLGIKKITMNSKGGSIIFKENTDISYEKLLDLLNEREIYRMKGPYQVNIKMISNTPEDRFEIIENTLNRLKN